MRSPQDEQPTNGAAHSREGQKPGFFKSEYYKELIRPFFDDSEIQKAIKKFRHNNLVNGFHASYEQSKVTKSYIDENGNWIIEWDNK